MKVIQKLLMVALLGYIISTAIIIFVFEFGKSGNGWLADNKILQFWLQLIMEIITIACIPFALRLFKFNFVKKALIEQREKGLAIWGLIRIDLLCIPMGINAFLYEMTFSPVFGYLGIILFLCIFFIIPTKKRCEDEINIEP